MSASTTAARAGATAWGLLSTAAINDRILAAAHDSDAVRLVAVASRDLAKARRYATRHGLERAHGSYEELLADPALDVVYISLPNHLHIEWAIRALRAGKHVLCEKPLSRDPSEVARAFGVASETGRLLMEGFMWRHHPQTRMAKRLLSQGAIGRVEEVRCDFGFDLVAERTSQQRRWQDDTRLSAECDGGVLMDVGTYCINAIRHFAGEPDRVTATHELGPTGVSVRATGVLESAGRNIGRFNCTFVDPRREQLEIQGEEGTMVISTPFLAQRPGIQIRSNGEERMLPGEPANPYRLEVENLSEAILGQADPLLDERDAVAQAQVLHAAAESARLGLPVPVGGGDSVAESKNGRG